MRAHKLEQKLYQVASLQQGYFTARQAKEAGYSDSRFPYHLKEGRWHREGRGIYKLTNYPMGERPDLVYWSLWSCSQKGQIQGVFSHQTALAIHDLSDLMPAKYHLSVPKGFRKFHPIPKNLVLHFGELEPHEILELEGFKVTSPERTIYDVSLDETISEEFAIQAILDGHIKGMAHKKEIIHKLARIDTDRINRIINEVEKN